MMRVLIVGCGYVGLPLGAELVRLGHEVFGLRRDPAAESDLQKRGHPALVRRRDGSERPGKTAAGF